METRQAGQKSRKAIEQRLEHYKSTLGDIEKHTPEEKDKAQHAEEVARRKKVIAQLESELSEFDSAS